MLSERSRICNFGCRDFPFSSSLILSLTFDATKSLWSPWSIQTGCQQQQQQKTGKMVEGAINRANSRKMIDSRLFALTVWPPDDDDSLFVHMHTAVIRK